MTRRACRYLMAFIALLAAIYGCQRIPLYEMTTSVYLDLKLNLDIDLDLDLSVETELDAEYAAKLHGKMPEYVEVLFYDKETHKMVSSQILNAEGGDIDVPAGDYHMVVYNFGTESTQVGNLNHRHEAEAFTSDITQQMASKLQWFKSESDTTKASVKGYEDDPIIHEPDHLYVANEPDIHIPSFVGKEESVTIHTVASSIIDVYSLEVLNIKGAENIEKVEALITGQIKSNYFGKGERSLEPATLYTDMRIDTKNQRLYSIFGTFGKQPGEENKVYLDITVTDSGGGQYRYIYDVTDQFDEPENDNNKLVIDAGGDIDIPDAAHGGGGLAPSVDLWENENIDIQLG